MGLVCVCALPVQYFLILPVCSNHEILGVRTNRQISAKVKKVEFTKNVTSSS
jgi:hypothetical protein